MSGVRPLFVSAPRCRILLNGQPLAYAIGINVNVRVDVQNVFVMGQYDSLTTEPLMYGLVSGTIQIVKLNSAAELALRAAAAKGQSPLESSPTAEGVPIPVTNTTNTNSALGLPGLSYHLNPQYVLASETFDLDIQINHLDPDNLSADKSLMSTLFRIQNCRFTGSNINIALGSLVNEPLTFQGLLAMDFDKNQNPLQAADNAVADGTF